MFRRSIAVACLAAALAAGAGWIATRSRAAADGSAPLAPEAEPVAARAVKGRERGALDEDARTPSSFEAEAKAAAPAPPAEIDFVEEPAPGEFEGPWARGSYPSGEPRFEAQQAQRGDGVWVLDGEWTAWHENGRVLERGRYRLHEQEGLWEWWDEAGRPIARGSFLDGARQGPWTYWYADGTRRMDAYYESGRAEGRWTYYREDGTKRAEGSFVEGELDGYWAIWGEDGELDRERSGQYRQGWRVGD